MEWNIQSTNLLFIDIGCGEEPIFPLTLDLIRRIIVGETPRGPSLDLKINIFFSS